MGVDSLYRQDRRITARNAKTGKAVTLVVWVAGYWPRDTTHVAPVGGGQLERLARGRYRDAGGTEYVSDDPDAP